MEHLTPLDAGFLHTEDSDPHVSLAIGAASVISGPPPSFDEFITYFSKRVRTIPRLTEVLHTHAFDLAAPNWVKDPDFDVARHVYRVALPQPADDTELFRMIATVMQQRLDRERPLWECWVIEGLAGGQWAILIKLHHCIADGIAATQMLSKLSDGGGTRKRTHESGDSSHRSVPPTWFGINPLRWTKGVWRAAAAIEHAGVGAIELASGLLNSPSVSSLTGSVTTLRRYSAVEVKLADMERVAKVFDVTINDVALAAITHGYRNLLLNRGEPPRHDSMRALVPVSVRSMKDLDRTDNQVSAMLPLLPVDEADPAKQLELVHDRLVATKGSGQRQGGTTLLAVANAIPFAMSAWMIRLLTRLPQHGVAAVATNVPGPRRRQTLMGRAVIKILPVAPIALGLRTGIAMVSYADTFVFAITADRDTAPDIDEFASDIKQGVAQLMGLTSGSRRARAVGA